MLVSKLRTKQWRAKHAQLPIMGFASVMISVSSRGGPLGFNRIYSMTQITTVKETSHTEKTGRPATGNDPVRSFRMPDELMGVSILGRLNRTTGPVAPKPSVGWSRSV